MRRCLGPYDAAMAEIRPADIAAPAANYAHAVLTDGASRWLHTSGVVPVASDGSTPDALADQAARGVDEHHRDAA